MSAALWDVLGKAANLAQLFGLQAVMLVGGTASLLRIPQCKRKCDKLDNSARKLHALLWWPTGCEAVIQRSEIAGSVIKTLQDAHSLVYSYNQSTLWRRVRQSRSIERHIQDMQNNIDNCYELVVSINGYLIGLVNDRSQIMGAITQRTADAEASTTPESPDTQRTIVQEGIGSQLDNAVDLEYETMLAIVISPA